MSYQELIERLDKASGPDRELDAAILGALLDAHQERNWYAWQSSRPKGTPGKPARLYWLKHGGAITASIEAALALVERMLPGSMRRVYDDPDGGARCDLVLGNGGRFSAECATWALAILAALLRALSQPERR